MAKHKKPTKEELQEQERIAIEEAEKLEAQEPKEPVEPEEEIVEEPTDEELETEETPETPETPEEEPEEEAEPSEEEEVKLKKKLSASARENQKIYAKNRVINKALVDADEMPEPTDEEMTKEFTDWDMMSDLEKTLAKETVISRNWRKVISQAKEQATKIEKWNEAIEEFVDDPKTLNANPALEGKLDDFKEFATTEENNNVPMKILVSAFLHEQSTGKPPKKGRMFETGSGGPNTKPTPKTGKISLEDARKLRETNYDKWKQMVVAGKIDSGL